MPKYMISRTTKTLDVFEIEAERPLDAGILFGRLDALGQLTPVASRTLGVSYTQPQVAVADPLSADANVQGTEDHQDAHGDNNAQDEPTNGAHGDGGTPDAHPSTQPAPLRMIKDEPQA